jgi:hypothetical protein
MNKQFAKYGFGVYDFKMFSDKCSPHIGM